VALLIANSNYPMRKFLCRRLPQAPICWRMPCIAWFVVDVVRDATARDYGSGRPAEGRGPPRLGRAGLFWRIRSPVERPKLHDSRRRKIWEERDVRRDGVSVEETLSELSGSGARKQIAIVDAPPQSL